jgi:YgiT-type zinc finger domain-containing protein
MLTPICPLCGGQVVEKEVEKIVKGGDDVAILRVKAGVCEKCGERFYTKEVHKKIEDIRSELKQKLKQKATKMYKPIGRTYAYKSVID